MSTESVSQARPESLLDRKDQNILQWLGGRRTPATLNEIRDLTLFEEGYAEATLKSLQARQFIIWTDGEIRITKAGQDALMPPSQGLSFRSIRNSA